MTLLRLTLPLALALLMAVPAMAQGLRFGAFVDAYYAFDLNDPPSRLRAFTTQPVRHNTFSVNLAALRGEYTSDQARAAFVWGVGDYVESNYAAEPEYLRGLIEAYGGVRLAGGVWVDAGVLLSHIGPESPYSTANLTLGRSLIAEFSPYYETGVRVSYAPSDRLSLAGLVLNGWQNIAETNDAKAFGTQVSYRLAPNVLLNWSSFIGNEAPDSSDARTRIFNDLYATWAVSPALDVVAAFDFGFQRRPEEDDYTAWQGGALIGRYRLSPAVAVNGRAEFYDDPDETIVVTAPGAGFQVVGASLGLDVTPASNAFVRFEVRGFKATEEVFPDEEGLVDTDVVFHTSVALNL
jgi:hypothetical protein